MMSVFVVGIVKFLCVVLIRYGKELRNPISNQISKWIVIVSNNGRRLIY